MDPFIKLFIFIQKKLLMDANVTKNNEYSGNKIGKWKALSGEWFFKTVLMIERKVFFNELSDESLPIKAVTH